MAFKSASEIGLLIFLEKYFLFCDCNKTVVVSKQLRLEILILKLLQCRQSPRPPCSLGGRSYLTVLLSFRFPSVWGVTFCRKIWQM